MRLILGIILLAAILFTGCNGTPTNVNSNANGNANNALSIKPPQAIKPVDVPDPKFKPCNRYFPLVPGSIAKYVINYSSGIVGDLTVVVDAADEDGRSVFTQRSQLVDRSGGMQITQSTVRRFVCDGDRVQILSEKTESNIGGQQSSADFEYRENSLAMTDPKSILTKGATWTHAFHTVLHSPGQAPARSEEALGQPRGYNNGILFEGGSILFIAGQVGWDRESRIVSDDFAEQFVQALENVLAVVRQAGGGPENIGRLLIFVTDKDEYESRLRDIGSAYRQLMGKHFPAMTLVEVGSLLERLAKVEIEALAVIPAPAPSGNHQ